MKARLVKRFEDEINELERELKTQLPKEIQRARELGDLRENAEYKAAKERQEFLQARIGMLKKRVAEIALMNVDRIPKDKAGLGSTVGLIESTGDRGDLSARHARRRRRRPRVDLDRVAHRSRHRRQGSG